MKKIVAAIIGLIGLYSVSCGVYLYNQPEKKSCMQFVEHLTEVDNILNDTIWPRWCVWSRPEPQYDDLGYVLKYDTGTSLSKWPNHYYINFYRFRSDTIEPVFETVDVDTTLLCKCWGIEKDSFQTHINKICKYIRKITAGYNINTAEFFKQGLYYFESQYNGWIVIYQKDTVLIDAKQQEFKSKLGLSSYSQVGSTRFWVVNFEEK